MFVANKLKSTRRLLFQKQEIVVNPISKDLRTTFNNEEKVKAIKFLSAGNHGVHPLKFKEVNGVTYLFFAQTTHHPNDEMKEYKMTHSFFEGKTRTNHVLFLKAPIEYILPFLIYDKDNVISSKQEKALLGFLKNIYNEPINSILLLKASNLEDALIEISHLIETKIILDKDYVLSEEPLNALIDDKAAVFYKIRYKMMLSDYIELSSLKPVGRSVDVFFENQLNDPTIIKPVKDFIETKCSINLETKCLINLETKYPEITD